MHCVYCGYEVREGRDFCSKCGKRAGIAKPAVRSGFVVALFVVFFAGFGRIVHFVRADRVAAKTTANRPDTPQLAQLKTYTESVDPAFTVPRLQHKAYKVRDSGRCPRRGSRGPFHRQRWSAQRYRSLGYECRRIHQLAKWASRNANLQQWQSYTRHN